MKKSAAKKKKTTRSKPTLLEVVKPQQPFVVHTPVMMSATAANPVKYNPRKISPQDFESLKQSIRTYGFLDPIAVQKQGSNIIGGHQRMRALIDLCREAGIDPSTIMIPAIVLDISDRDAKKLNVALNNVHGEFDTRLLRELLASMHQEQQISPEETSLMGLDDKVIANMVASLAEPTFVPEGEDAQGKLDVQTGTGTMSWLITCPNCKHEFKHKAAS